ncbi:hypothetical protein ACYA13_28205 [Klebsiella pneumoniae]
MENNLENLTIGVFAKAAGVNVETIRFYQRKVRILVKLNSDSGICEHHFRKVC